MISVVDVARALASWAVHLLAIAPLYVLQAVVVPIGCRWFTHCPDEHAFGYPVTREHTPEVVAMGSSGQWVYEIFEARWWLLPYRDIDQGLRGDVDGTPWSLKCKGREHTWWSKVKQCYRNPVNGLRFMPFFTCNLNDCTLTWKGDQLLQDIEHEGWQTVREGWQFVKAVSSSGRKYYGFRVVHRWNHGRVFQVRIGHKIEPPGNERIDSDLKALKKFTFRLNPYKRVHL